jgi:predicted secreted Zn-dependent protease
MMSTFQERRVNRRQVRLRLERILSNPQLAESARAEAEALLKDLRYEQEADQRELDRLEQSNGNENEKRSRPQRAENSIHV